MRFKLPLLSTVYFVGFFIGASAWGRLADMLGRRHALFLGVLWAMVHSLELARETVFALVPRMKFAAGQC